MIITNTIPRMLFTSFSLPFVSVRFFHTLLIAVRPMITLFYSLAKGVTTSLSNHLPESEKLKEEFLRTCDPSLIIPETERYSLAITMPLVVPHHRKARDSILKIHITLRQITECSYNGKIWSTLFLWLKSQNLVVRNWMLQVWFYYFFLVVEELTDNNFFWLCRRKTKIHFEGREWFWKNRLFVGMCFRKNYNGNNNCVVDSLISAYCGRAGSLLVQKCS